MLDVPKNRRLLPASPWTEAKVARLKKMRAAGSTNTEIGADLGFSNGAIAGKVDRLGLDKRERPKGSPRQKRQNAGGALAQRLNAKHRMVTKLRVRSPSNGGAGGNLKAGKQVSCGCHQREIRFGDHGGKGELYFFRGLRKSRSPGYPIWRNMVQRCHSPEDRAHHYYGARGITVCDRWLNGDGTRNGYECFVADMWPRPGRGYSIERKDNNRGYEPDNCRWATAREQARNRRDTMKVMFEGEETPLIAACEKLNVDYRLTADRVRHGWSFERAISAPKKGAAA